MIDQNICLVLSISSYKKLSCSTSASPQVRTIVDQQICHSRRCQWWIAAHVIGLGGEDSFQKYCCCIAEWKYQPMQGWTCRRGHPAPIVWGSMWMVVTKVSHELFVAPHYRFFAKLKASNPSFHRIDSSKWPVDCCVTFFRLALLIMFFTTWQGRPVRYLEERNK